MCSFATENLARLGEKASHRLCDVWIPAVLTGTMARRTGCDWDDGPWVRLFLKGRGADVAYCAPQEPPAPPLPQNAAWLPGRCDVVPARTGTMRHRPANPAPASPGTAQLPRKSRTRAARVSLAVAGAPGPPRSSPRGARARSPSLRPSGPGTGPAAALFPPSSPATGSPRHGPGPTGTVARCTGRDRDDGPLSRLRPPPLPATRPGSGPQPHYKRAAPIAHCPG